MLKRRRTAVCLAVAGALLAGCAGGSSQVIVRNDTDPYNQAVAQRTANDECAARGAGPAHFVMMLNNPSSISNSTNHGRPDFVFECGASRAAAPLARN